MATARLASVELQSFARSEVAPELPSTLYPLRLERLRARAAERGHQSLVVYADREHSANLAYLTGFDPRFEEAILVIGGAGRPGLLTGNECIGLAGKGPLPVEAILFQELSLPSQPRDRSTPLADLLLDPTAS